MKSDMAHGFVEFDMGAKLPMSMMNFSPCLLCMEVGTWFFIGIWHSLSWFIKVCRNDLNV